MTRPNRDNGPRKSRDYCQREIGNAIGYDENMPQTFRTALLNYIESRQISLAELSRISGVSHEQLKKLKQRPTGRTNVDDASRITHALGVSLDDLLGETMPHMDTIAVVGRVGAGAKVPLVDAYGKGEGLYHVIRPAQLSSNGFVAVEVEGNSMEPAYEHGDVLFYSRAAVGVPADAVGKRCVCEDSNGDGWVKLLRRRDNQPHGLFDLLSFHADSAPMYDVELRWASPIRMHLPQDLVDRIESA
jgi:phage repressor protein C with HTH and peptisase S24 domain